MYTLLVIWPKSDIPVNLPGFEITGGQWSLSPWGNDDKKAKYLLSGGCIWHQIKPFSYKLTTFATNWIHLQAFQHQKINLNGFWCVFNCVYGLPTPPPEKNGISPENCEKCPFFGQNADFLVKFFIEKLFSWAVLINSRQN